MYGDTCVGWLSRTQFLELGKWVPPVILRGDNEGAICSAQTPLSSGRTTHINVRYHYTTDFVSWTKVKIGNVLSEGQHTDTLTKRFSIDW